MFKENSALIKFHLPCLRETNFFRANPSLLSDKIFFRWFDFLFPKYKFVTDLTEDLFILIKHFIGTKNQFKYLKSFFDKDKTILIPIPLYWQRENWRGFNQSKLLGEKLADCFRCQLRDDILIRQKATLPQVGLEASQRQKNIQGVFRINYNHQIPKDFSLLLFDDVWTTGSTLKEAGGVRFVGKK